MALNMLWLTLLSKGGWTRYNFQRCLPALTANGIHTTETPLGSCAKVGNQHPTAMECRGLVFPITFTFKNTFYLVKRKCF